MNDTIAELQKTGISSSQSASYSLNGKTILRFTHMLRGRSGGIEQHLSMLNHKLLKKNSMVIIQIYSTYEEKKLQIETEKIGLGTLIWVPVLENYKNGKIHKIGKRIIWEVLGFKFLLSKLFSYFPSLSILFHNYLSQKLNKQNSQIGIKKILVQLFNQYKIDLVIMHTIGSPDCREVIDEISKRSVPYSILNHFNNKKFEQLSVQNQLLQAKLIGGISSINVPQNIRNSFWNLSNCVNINFFNPEKYVNQESSTKETIIFLPARICPVKGHIDLLKAARILRGKKLRFKIIFAGRNDARVYFPEFEIKLMNYIQKFDLKNDVIFKGHLSQKKLRDLYVLSDIIVLPSHNEGLGRVLLEAQAMKKPVIAYNVGGVKEAVLNNCTGFIIKKGDIKSLAQKIEILIKNENTRKKFGNAGRIHVVSNFSLSKLVERHEKFYIGSLQLSNKN